jgi:arginine decarboxylase
MDIYIATAACEGSTELSAFDACLSEVGIGDLNLLYLSSVIPNEARLLLQHAPTEHGQWGDRCYCVMAQCRTSVIGHEAWAGIAWVREHETGRGLFAEAHGASEAEVRLQLRETLEDMTRRRSCMSWEPIETRLAGVTCTGTPVCAIATAVYTTESFGA